MSSTPIHNSENGDVEMQSQQTPAPQSQAQFQGNNNPTTPGGQSIQSSGSTNGNLQAAAASSPLAFPSSSPAKSLNPAGTPLSFPSSSPNRTPRANPNARPGAPSSGLNSDGFGANRGSQGDGPLFFPSSGSSSNRRYQRSELRSNVPLTSPSVSRRPRAPQGQDGLDGPASSANGGQNSDFSLSQQTPTTDPAGREGDTRMIWGTTVSVGETMYLFREFIHHFKLKYRLVWQKENGIISNINIDDREDGEKLVYHDYLRRMRLTSQFNLNLNINDLEAFPSTKKLATSLKSFPAEVVAMLDQVLKDEIIDIAEMDKNAGRFGMDGEDANDILFGLGQNVYKCRPFGLKSVNMRSLNPKDIDKLVTIKGLIIRATPIIPDMKTAFFRCLACNETVTSDIDRGVIPEPDRCPREVCSQQGSISLIHNRCTFQDRQIVRIQETPDSVPDGQTPHTVSLCVYDELVDCFKPGDRVEVTGIFRSTPVRVNPRQRTQKSLFKTFLDVVHLRRSERKRLGVDASTRDEDDHRGFNNQAAGVGGEDAEEGDPVTSNSRPTQGSNDQTEEETEAVERLRAIAEREDVYDLLSRSLAPSIYEMDDVKKGILLQLFGGTHKSIPSGGGSGGPRFRGDINVLMVGDPGTSKSQILMYVHKIAPRGVYASGKGSSAVGLTAYVTRDPDTKQLVLESGALVLSDGGVCCIDEFDKMSDATRSVLHEVMEQQTVSIAKAGIITTLNARTSLLAAANPIGSKYNVKLPITKNIDLPPTLISRFDLVYLVLDKIDEASDRRLARHLVGLYLEDTPEHAGGAAADILPVETLTSYISYARNHIHPALSAEAADALATRYVELRRAGEDVRSAERRITATTRQLESMIRLSEAHARMRFSPNVELEDVEEACRLIREAAKSSATDPVTGLIDLDLINTGRGTHARKIEGDLRKEFLNLLDAMGGSGGPQSTAPSRAVRYSELLKALNDQSSLPIDAAELQDVVRILESEGVIKTAGDRDRRTVRRIDG